jgi:N-acetylglucosaminyl-diphospho-decaprenol L-rhamnosyltransferase
MATAASLIVVNYKSASLAVEAIRTARAATRTPLQVVVVDNSVDSAEADALRVNADVLIAAESNLGYAAAINRARRSCDGDVLLVSNPDVRYGAESIDRLLDAGADVAGPALYWDDAFQWILPPSELHTAVEAVDAALASRWSWWDRLRDRRRIQKRLAFWSLAEPTSVPAISGAVMAIRRAAFDAVGGFDERFFLYFEEIDFVRRVRSEIVYVPAARCRHIYNQSAGPSVESAAQYARAEIAYLAKWSSVARFTKGLERRRPIPAMRLLEGESLDVGSNVVVEASPLATFDTAAGHFPIARRVVIPPEVWQAYHANVLYLRVIDRDSASVLATCSKTRIAA